MYEQAFTDVAEYKPYQFKTANTLTVKEFDGFDSFSPHKGPFKLSSINEFESNAYFQRIYNSGTIAPSQVILTDVLSSNKPVTTNLDDTILAFQKEREECYNYTAHKM